MNSSFKALACEFAGSAILIFIGCGSVVIGGLGAALPVSGLAVGLAFGLTVIALAYAIGPISGCHINPSATIALWLAGRFPAKNILPYVLSQTAGGICGALVLWLIATGRTGGYDVSTLGLAQNGWGSGYLGQYSTLSAFVFEVLGSFILMFVILLATARSANATFAPIAIGSTVTVIILCFINVTGVSLNPMRSIAPALFVGSKAVSQLWLFLVAPTLGMALAAIAHRSFGAEE